MCIRDSKSVSQFRVEICTHVSTPWVSSLKPTPRIVWLRNVGHDQYHRTKKNYHPHIDYIGLFNGLHGFRGCRPNCQRASWMLVLLLIAYCTHRRGTSSMQGLVLGLGTKRTSTACSICSNGTPVSLGGDFLSCPIACLLYTSDAADE